MARASPRLKNISRFKLKRVRERIARALMDRGSRETRALYPRWKNFPPIERFRKHSLRVLKI